MPIIKEDPLHRYNPSDFNFKNVKGEVSEAMQFDWKRDKVDDAKKKAIYDSKNYDEFKSRVAGCTLRPIHRDEFNAPPKFAYNRQAQKASAGIPGVNQTKEMQAVPTAARAAAGRSSESSRVPRSGHEFEREFRRRTGATERVALLDCCSEEYGRIFARELDVEVFRQLLEALDEADGTDSEDRRVARSFLASLVVDCPSATAGASVFLTDQERTIIARLLAREPAANPEEDVRICASFGVTPSRVAEHLQTSRVNAQQNTGEGVLQAPVNSCEADLSGISASPATLTPAAQADEAAAEVVTKTEATPAEADSDLTIPTEPLVVPDVATETFVQGGYDADAMD